jgi:hypothetical protein
LSQGAKAIAPFAEAPTSLTERQIALRVELIGYLEQSAGNVASVARRMKKAPMQVYRWMRALGIDPRTFR